jgi:hypothetical protein
MTPHSVMIRLRLALLEGCHCVKVRRSRRYSLRLTACTAGLNAGEAISGLLW